LEFSVSTTTREPRRSEVDGTDYNFVDRETFREMQEDGEFLEYAEVHGEMYGTSRRAVIDAAQSGKDVLLEIDVQGGEQVREKLPNAVLVFIAPPSLDELKQRLKSRGTETPEEIRERLEVSRQELEYADQYDYVVINDEIDSAVKKVRSIRTAEKCRLNRQSGPGLPTLVSD
jgi:guanylate kinase